MTRSISHCYPNIEVIVSGLLPRDIHWSTRRVKINETNDYLKDYCERSKKMTFMRQDPDWTLPDNSLNMELYYKDHLHLIENGNIKFSKLIIETLQDVLSPQSSQSSIIITLATIIIDQIATSIVRTQVKPSINSNAFPSIFISIIVSHSNTLQPETSKIFVKFSDCSTRITNIDCITTLSPRFFLITQENF